MLKHAKTTRQKAVICTPLWSQLVPPCTPQLLKVRGKCTTHFLWWRRPCSQTCLVQVSRDSIFPCSIIGFFRIEKDGNSMLPLDKSLANECFKEEPAMSKFVKRQLSTLRQAYELTREHLGHAAHRRKHHYDLRTRSHKYPVGSWVWVYVPRRRTGQYQKWRSLYEGPFQVEKHLGPVNYLVRRGTKSRPWIVHVDKLKPCHQDHQDLGITARVDTDTPTDSEDPPDTRRPRRNMRLPVRFRD